MSTHAGYPRCTWTGLSRSAHHRSSCATHLLHTADGLWHTGLLAHATLWWHATHHSTTHATLLTGATALRWHTHTTTHTATASIRHRRLGHARTATWATLLWPLRASATSFRFPLPVWPHLIFIQILLNTTTASARTTLRLGLRPLRAHHATHVATHAGDAVTRLGLIILIGGPWPLPITRNGP